MKAYEQTEFVESLMKNIGDKVTSEIHSGKIPKNWDGIELREYLADAFGQESGYISGARKREYKNTKIANNLHY